MEIRVLGPLEATVAGQGVALGGPKQRAVLTMLALAAGRTVTVDELIDAVWGEDAHERAQNTLQVYVSNLRKVLEPNRTPGAPPTVLRSRPGGYSLDVPTDSVDALRAERLITEARAALAASRPAEADRMLSDALACWHGTPLADLTTERLARHEAVRLEELRAGALESRMEARLTSGRAAELVAELESLVHQYPYRERLRGQLMIALYRSGRQADALGAYRSARATLLDEIGIDPSAELQDLERRILQQDPDLFITQGHPRTTDGIVIDKVEDEATTIRVATGGLGAAFLVTADGTKLALSDRPFTIGRHRDNDLTLADVDVSRRHAAVRPAGQAFIVRDLGSTNGTEVNGTSVEEHTLLPGDQITVGDTVLVFELGDTTRAEPSN